MRLFKSLLLVLAASGLTLLAPGAFAADVQEGKDYVLLSPVLANDSPGKIEVIEFFWYGCSHCHHFEPTFSQWSKKAGKDVVVRFIPAPLNPVWATGAKLFYALEALGVQEKLRGEIFAAIHNENQLSPSDERGFAPWLAKKGVDSAKFSEVYSSFAVQSKVQRAVQLAQASKIDGTPSVIIAGRYRILNPNALSPERFAEVADALVAKARKESGK